MMFIWIFAIGFGIYYLSQNKNLNINNNSSDALEKLKERYINGEIEEEEYLRIKNNINN